MDHFINALRHDRIDSLDEVTNVAARMALQDRFSKIVARKADGEESDGDAEQTAFGQSGECAHLTVKFLQFDPVDKPGKHAEKDPDDEPATDVNQKHRHEPIEWLFPAEVRSQIATESEGDEITYNQRSK